MRGGRRGVGISGGETLKTKETEIDEQHDDHNEQSCDDTSDDSCDFLPFVPLLMQLRQRRNFAAALWLSRFFYEPTLQRKSTDPPKPAES